MATLHVDVVSAEEAIFTGEAKFVVLPGEAGELGILPGHTPLISRIRPGTVKIVRADEGEENIFVAGGILEVQPGSVTVLADTAIRAADLDEARAVAAREKAEEALRNAKDKADIAVVEAELAMLAAQAVAARKLRQGRTTDCRRALPAASGRQRRLRSPLSFLAHPRTHACAISTVWRLRMAGPHRDALGYGFVHRE
ncbi:ATP synthase subunit epsilon [Bordetella pertussis]|nr:ATP synthase subunit epsilon [Bordetella pertussis]